MSISIVRAALESRLKTWADAQPIAVAYQNVAFSKPTSAPFLECFLVPNITLNREVSGKRKTLLGLFQINVWVQQGTGMGQAEVIAEQLVNLFPLIPKIGVVSIESTPTVRSPIPDMAGWVVTPVIMQYRYET